MNRRELMGMSTAAILAGLPTVSAASPQKKATPKISFDRAPRLSLAERDRRWAIAREIMKRAEVDGLIVYGDRESSAGPLFTGQLLHQ